MRTGGAKKRIVGVWVFVPSMGSKSIALNRLNDYQASLIEGVNLISDLEHVHLLIIYALLSTHE
jgi:hypothetical protein